MACGHIVRDLSTRIGSVEKILPMGRPSESPKMLLTNHVPFAFMSRNVLSLTHVPCSIDRTPALFEQSYQGQLKIEVIPVGNSVLKILSIKHVPTPVPS